MSIKVENIYYTYQKGMPFEQKALINVSLEVKNGDIFGIIGTAGSGKSTLLQMFNGLLRPDQGKVLINGHATGSMTNRQLAELRREVGLVMQFPEQQMFELTVGSDIAFGPWNLGLNTDEAEKRVEWAMNLVDLPYKEFKDRSPRHLSSGQKRRAALAGVLALQPNYLVLDEPTAGLDANGQRTLLANLARLNREQGTTIIIVSHHLSELLAICKQLLVLVNGEVLGQGDIWSVLDNGRELAEQGFNMPVSREVVEKLKQRGWNIDTRVRNTQEASRAITQALKS